MRCSHKRIARVSSTVERCQDCGMLNAMIAGKTSIYRRWVAPTDPRIDPGTKLTQAFLEQLRRAVVPG
jgi:hypothetical protein